MKLLKKMGAILLSLCMITTITLQLDNSVAKAEAYETIAGSKREVNYECTFEGKNPSNNLYTVTRGTKQINYKEKMSVNYGETTFTVGLKIESDINIKFTAPSAGELILVFSAASKKILINGVENISASDFSVKYNVEQATEIEITRKEATELVYMNFIPASTPDPEPTTAPVTQLGYSYREETDQYGNGIRFGGKLDLNQVDENARKNSGTLIGLKNVVKEAQMTLEDAGITCLKIERDTYIEKTDEYLEYAASIVNIPEGNLETEIVARPYVIIDGTAYYGEQISTTYKLAQEKGKQ